MPIRSAHKRTLIGVLGLAAGVAAGGFALQSQVRPEGAELLHSTIGLLTRAFSEPVSPAELYEAAAEGLVKQLNDPYSELLSPKELEAFRREAMGNYGGVGLLIENVEGEPVVMQVYPGTPAAEQGVRTGDRILAVDGHPAEPALDRVSERLRGAPGSEVVVEFQRADRERLHFTLVRRRIQIPSVPFATLVDSGIGYVPLRRFSESTAREVAVSLQKLYAQGARAFVLDLRGNGGGQLDQAIAVSNLFLPQGTRIAGVAYRNQPEERYVAEREPLSTEIPLAVLIDGASASASEIVAGALQDHDRALVVGTRSFGKGLVQQLFPLEGGWVLKLTTGRWITPSGRSIQRTRDARGRPLQPDSSREGLETFRTAAGRTIRGGGGIVPDVVVEFPPPDPQGAVLARLLGSRIGEFHGALSATAYEMRGRVDAEFQVDAPMRQRFLERLTAQGVDLTPAQQDSLAPLLDRLIAGRVVDRLFGESAAFHRGLSGDPQLGAVIERLRGATSTESLLRIEEPARPPAA